MDGFVKKSVVVVLHPLL